jgi:RimJ/RimL family protein N-acetyltransferase
VPAHARPLYDALLDEELYRYLDIKPPSSAGALEAQYRLWSARRSPDGSQRWLNWAARSRDTGEYVGWFQSTVLADGSADIAYLVFRGQQRCGYAREACARVIDLLFDGYGTGKVRAVVDPRNLASIGLAQSLGMLRLAIPAENGDAVFELATRTMGSGPKR